MADEVTSNGELQSVANTEEVFGLLKIVAGIDPQADREHALKILQERGYYMPFVIDSLDHEAGGNLMDLVRSTIEREVLAHVTPEDVEHVSDERVKAMSHLWGRLSHASYEDIWGNGATGADVYQRLMNVALRNRGEEDTSLSSAAKAQLQICVLRYVEMGMRMRSIDTTDAIANSLRRMISDSGNIDQALHIDAVKIERRASGIAVYYTRDDFDRIFSEHKEIGASGFAEVTGVPPVIFIAAEDAHESSIVEHEVSHALWGIFTGVSNDVAPISDDVRILRRAVDELFAYSNEHPPRLSSANSGDHTRSQALVEAGRLATYVFDVGIFANTTVNPDMERIRILCGILGIPRVNDRYRRIEDFSTALGRLIPGEGQIPMQERIQGYVDEFSRLITEGCNADYLAGLVEAASKLPQIEDSQGSIRLQQRKVEGPGLNIDDQWGELSRLLYTIESYSAVAAIPALLQLAEARPRFARVFELAEALTVYECTRQGGDIKLLKDIYVRTLYMLEQVGQEIPEAKRAILQNMRSHITSRLIAENINGDDILRDNEEYTPETLIFFASHCVQMGMTTRAVVALERLIQGSDITDMGLLNELCRLCGSLNRPDIASRFIKEFSGFGQTPRGLQSITRMRWSMRAKDYGGAISEGGREFRAMVRQLVFGR